MFEAPRVAPRARRRTTSTRCAAILRKIAPPDRPCRSLRRVLRFLTEHEHAVLAAAADRLIPPLDAHPGGAALGVADYVDNLLGAFTFDPPLIFAGGPFSGRAGGEASFAEFLPLSRHEELAWRTRIEGSLGIAEREFNGPTRGWQEIYRDGIAALGADFLDGRRRRAGPPPARAARAARAASTRTRAKARTARPSTAATPTSRGWRAIQFPGDVQPRGYTDDEVRGRA